MTAKHDRRIRYAVVGLGNIAQKAILPAFAHADNSELTALVSGDSEKLIELAARYGVEHAAHYDDLEVLLEEDVADAVYIAVPNHRHRDLTERSARAGCHVLCEKPMAVTEEDCAAMIRCCEESGVRLMIAYRLHFDQANMEVVDRVRGGEIGVPRFFESTFSQDVPEGDVRLMPLNQGGGSLYDVGIYCINAARYLFRGEPLLVTGSSASREDTRFRACDEMTSAVLRFPEDRLAVFTSSLGAHDVCRYRIVGTEGEIVVDPAYKYSVGLSYRISARGKTRERSFPRRDQFAPELLHFSECILEGREPEPNGWEGLADVRIIEAIHRSAATGRATPTEPVAGLARPDAGLIRACPPVEEPDEPDDAIGPTASRRAAAPRANTAARTRSPSGR